jgi:hypothetical protein
VSVGIRCLEPSSRSALERPATFRAWGRAFWRTLAWTLRQLGLLMGESKVRKYPRGERCLPSAARPRVGDTAWGHLQPVKVGGRLGTCPVGCTKVTSNRRGWRVALTPASQDRRDGCLAVWDAWANIAGEVRSVLGSECADSMVGIALESSVPDQAVAHNPRSGDRVDVSEPELVRDGGNAGIVLHDAERGHVGSSGGVAPLVPRLVPSTGSKARATLQLLRESASQPTAALLAAGLGVLRDVASSVLQVLQPSYETWVEAIWCWCWGWS